jgi:hypothetical protein
MSMPRRKSYELGEGVLHWPVGEVAYLSRNCVALQAEGNQWVRFASVPIGQVMRLTAQVLTVRGPVLPEDTGRGVGPSIPFLNEVVVLGYGVLFVGDAHGEGITAIGVLPVEDVMRCDEWLDLFGVYRAHNHIVRLRAETGRAPHIVRQRTPVSAS